jgi:multidrug efflux pump subunit AcrB
VETTLVITIGLVALAIFMFLRKVWATIIPSITVPLALVATAGVMYMVGFNLDNISLMALTISVGFVVDDAIVMIENIVRYIEQGESPFAAAIKGAGQIGFTIISITFSLIAVFIPLLFMGGIIGRLFREFAVTVTTAVIASAFVSLTLTPMMCSLFLSHDDKSRQGRISQGAERFFDWLVNGYDRGLRWVFAHQPFMLIGTIGLIVLTGYLYVVIPKGFIPQQDTGFIFGALQMRQDTSFAAVSAMENQVAAIVQQDPAVSGVVGFAGAGGSNPSESTARLFIQLKPF